MTFLGRFIVNLVHRQVVLLDEMPLVVVGVLVAAAVADLPHQRRHRIAQVQRHRLVDAPLDLGLGLRVGLVDRVALRSGRQVDGRLRQRQLALRYAAAAGGSGDNVPSADNPNGSVADVAGICDASGRVFGLMPHPERHIDRTHHPRWTRGEAPEKADGMRLFENAVEYFAA